MKEENIINSTTKNEPQQVATEQHYQIDEEGKLNLLEEQHLLPSLETVAEYIPLDTPTNLEEKTNYNLIKWKEYLNNIITKYDNILLKLHNENKINLHDIDIVNKHLNNLFDNINTYYTNHDFNNIISHYNNVDYLYNNHLLNLKELLLLHYTV